MFPFTARKADAEISKLDSRFRTAYPPSHRPGISVLTLESTLKPDPLLPPLAGRAYQPPILLLAPGLANSYSDLLPSEFRFLFQ